MLEAARRWRIAGVTLITVALPLSAQQGPRNGADPPQPSSSRGHAVPAPALQAVERSVPIRLDGALDEAIWATAPVGTGFRQQRPTDGAPATQETEIRVLFDSEALYVGARMYDSLGADGIRSQLTRRDQQSESDWIQLIFDTYHDHIGRTIFAVNPAGVKQDAGQGSAFADPSWDPVWEVATAVDAEGWTAEFRIPFSQLRFSGGSDGGEQTWGLQVWRIVSRLNEYSMWAWWGVQEAGGASRFGHLDGIRTGARQRRGELVPYLVGQWDALRPGPDGDPFYRQHGGSARVGADLKYQLSSNFTLTATVSPDFGQVEVDPAVVNLSAFETFFPERRPFFVEGNGIFQYGSFNCFFCSNVQNLGLFYSRRIGRAPQGALPAGAEYWSLPEASTIRGAAKLTGRTANGWSVGLLDAVTSSERADVLLGGTPGTQEVEPLTNYFVGRVKRDLQGGNLTIGAIGTSVVRRMGDPLLDARLPSHAEAVGLDWNWFWGNRRYRFMGSVAASNVAGDPSAIDRIQRSSARYFQRPDRQHGTNGLFSNRYDPGATRLGGYGAYARVGKEAGSWLWEAAVNLRSPGFEVNDLAFLTRADYLWVNANLIRQFNRPTGWYRNLLLIGGAQQSWNWDGDLTDRQMHVFGNIEFLNYWSLGGFYLRRPETWDDRALRGGPTVRRPAIGYGQLFVNSDGRKPVSVEARAATGSNAEGGPRTIETSVGIRLRPAANIQLSLSPTWSRNGSSQQYVTAREDATAVNFYGRRYVLADLEQESLSLNTRLNVTFTPTLSLELFAQPFISSVRYDRFKEFETPGALGKQVYGEDVGSIAPVRNPDGVLTAWDIDPDGTGRAPFRLDNPDFSFRSLRGNAVLRWEWRPGSTVYLVWTQDRNSTERFTGDLSLGRNWDGLQAARPNNILLVKFSYWLNF